MFQLRLIWVTAITSVLLSRFILDLRTAAAQMCERDNIGQVTASVTSAVFLDSRNDDRTLRTEADLGNIASTEEKDGMT